MVILRTKVSENYTLFSNNLLRDRTISYEARGILIELLSYPSDWKIQKKHFVTSHTKRDKIFRIFNELENAGYICSQYRDDLRQYEWIITDKPTLQKSRKIRHKNKKAENKKVGKSDLIPTKKSENPTLLQNQKQESRKIRLNSCEKVGKSDFLVNDFARKSENPTLLNTIYIYKKEKKEKYKKERKEKKTKIDSNFEFFKSNYPNRSPSDDWFTAQQKWQARLREGEDHQKIIDGCLRYRKYCEAENIIGTKYVYMAKTFLGPSKHYNRIWEIKNANRTAKTGMDIYFNQK